MGLHVQPRLIFAKLRRTKYQTLDDSYAERGLRDNKNVINAINRTPSSTAIFCKRTRYEAKLKDRQVNSHVKRKEVCRLDQIDQPRTPTQTRLSQNPLIIQLSTGAHYILSVVTLLIGLSHTVSAQTSNELDSLKKMLSVTQCDMAKVVIYSRLSRLYTYNYNDSLDKSQAMADSAYVLVKGTDRDDLSAKLKLQYGAIFFRRYMLDSAMSYYDKVYLSTTDSVLHYEAAMGKGMVHATKIETDKAISCGIGALDYFRDKDNATMLSRSYIMLGYAYLYAGDKQQALKHFKRALLIDIPDKAMEHRGIYGNVGRLAFQLNELDTARKYLNSAIHYATGVDNILMSAYITMAQIHENANQYSKADSFYLCAFSLPSFKWSRESDARFGIYYVNALKKQGRMRDAYRYMDSLALSLEDAEHLYVKESYYRIKCALLEAKGDYKAALEAYEIYYEVTDSIKSQETEKNFLELSSKFNVAEKELEIQELDNEKRITDIKYTNAYRATVAALIIIILLMAFVLYRRRQRLRLERQSKIIAEALADREILLREIHHRVKNNLQVVSALLELQARHIEDEDTRDSLQKGRHRVESMALIHQELYQHDVPSGIHVKNYISRLVDSLLITYEQEGRTVFVEQTVDDIILDVDTIVPLGLLLNEILTNALKYAFKDQEVGHIEVNMRMQSEDLLTLKVKDDGIGMNLVKLKEATGFGLELCNTLAKKLGAEIIYTSNNGLEVDLSIRQFSVVN